MLKGPALAAALMGGITVATVLTLFFLPALYATWFRVPSPASTPARLTTGRQEFVS